MTWRLLHRFSFVAVVLSVVVLSGGIANARDFTIVGWGGTFQRTLSDMYFKPFANAKGISFLEDVYLGGWGVFQAMKDTGNISWDVVEVETSELVRGCEDGVFVPLNWSRIADASKLIPEAISRCGVGMSVWTVVMGFNENRLSKRPERLEDFWDLKTWPGKRGMRQGPKMNLEFALMADGVPPSEVYRTLSKPEGVDRAFRKLDEIKPALRLWKAGAQAPEWLLAHEVTMSTAYINRIVGAKNEGKSLDFIWDHAIYAVDSWAVLNGSPHVGTAYEFLKFYVNSDKHNEWATTSLAAPTVIDAINRMTPEMRKIRPYGDNVKNALFMGDEHLEFWLDNQEVLTQRWNAWLAKD